MTATTGYENNKLQALELGWLSLLNRAILFRATIVAIMIGSILTLVNQSGWVFGSDSLQLLQLILVFGLPFGVVTVSQIVGLRRAHLDSVGQTTHTIPKSIMATAVSHGIPARAVVIGLVFGTLNASIVLADTLLRSDDLAAVSVVSLGQAYVLPLVFAVLSQVVSYRRYRYQVVKA
jgi:hypothetical protein